MELNATKPDQKRSAGPNPDLLAQMTGMTLEGRVSDRPGPAATAGRAGSLAATLQRADTGRRSPASLTPIADRTGPAAAVGRASRIAALLGQAGPKTAHNRWAGASRTSTATPVVPPPGSESDSNTGMSDCSSDTSSKPRRRAHGSARLAPTTAPTTVFPGYLPPSVWLQRRREFMARMSQSPEPKAGSNDVVKTAAPQASGGRKRDTNGHEDTKTDAAPQADGPNGIQVVERSFTKLPLRTIDAIRRSITGELRDMAHGQQKRFRRWVHNRPFTFDLTAQGRLTVTAGEEVKRRRRRTPRK